MFTLQRVGQRVNNCIGFAACPPKGFEDFDAQGAQFFDPLRARLRQVDVPLFAQHALEPEPRGDALQQSLLLGATQIVALFGATGASIGIAGDESTPGSTGAGVEG